MERKTQFGFLMKREEVWQLWPWDNSRQHWHKQGSMARYLDLVIKSVNTNELSERRETKANFRR